MDELTVSACTWRSVPAWMVSGTRLEVVLTRCGGHLAALRRTGELLNPLWQPQWPASDPMLARQGGFYGGIEASLLASIVGHNLCLDRFGPPHAGETRPVHGESNIAQWEMERPDDATVSLNAKLPQAGLRVRTLLSMSGDDLVLRRGVYHAGPGSRTIEWCEHVSIGDPFLAGAQITAGIDEAYTWPAETEPGSRFANLPPGSPVPADQALPMPLPESPACGDVLAAPVRSPWWSVVNPVLDRRLTYRWQTQDFPWLTLWTQHRSRSGTPWSGRERARGMELTTKPFPDGLEAPERHPSWLGRPTTCRVEPGVWTEHVLNITWGSAASVPTP